MTFNVDRKDVDWEINKKPKLKLKKSRLLQKTYCFFQLYSVLNLEELRVFWKEVRKVSF